MRVKGKTIVVTGAGNGIGRELVYDLLQRGARVAAVDRKEDFLLDTLQALNEDEAERFSYHVLNIADLHAVEMLPAKVLELHGQIDGIINNAGIIQPFVRINDLDYASVERVMQVNFYGTLYMVKTFLPHLLSRPEAHIVNISSMGAFLPVPGQAVYGASKAAVKLLSEALQSELFNTKVHVSVVFPGAIGTNIMVNSGVEIKMTTQLSDNAKKYSTLLPLEAAEEIVDGMERNKKRIYVGKDSRFMNFLYRLSPAYASRMIARNMKNLLGD